MADLAGELQRIYDSKINVRISWFWDCGISVKLGDETNGFLAEEIVPSMVDIVPWLQEAIARFYPTSTYAASLTPEVHERAARRVFLAPKMGASAICPYCGASNSVPYMDELIAFVCSQCGASVTVQPPKIQ
jgi:hypothetical protein